MKMIFTILFATILCIGLVSATLEVGNDESIPKVEIVSPTPSTNYSTVNTNHSLTSDFATTSGSSGDSVQWAGNPFIAGAVSSIEADPKSLLLTGLNWALGNNWLTYVNPTLSFNYSRLIAEFFNSTQINSMIVNNNTYLRNNTNILVKNITATSINFLGITIWQTATTSNINLSINCTEGVDCVSPPQVIFPDVNNWTSNNYFDNITANLYNGMGITTWQTATTSNVNFSINCNSTSCVSPPWVIMPDNFNWTGNNIFNNLSGNFYYGEMVWASTNADNNTQWLKPTIFTTADTYYNFSNVTAGYSLASVTNGFSFSGGNALTSQVAGLYKFDGTCDYYTKSGGHTDMTLFVNGVATNMTTHRTAGKPNTIQPVAIQNVTPMSVFNSDLLYTDGTGLTFNELNGGLPVLDANFTFQLSGNPVILTNPLFLTFSGYYQGSDAHEIEVSVWNYTSGAWVNIRTATKDLPNSGLIPYSQTWKFPESTQDTIKNMMNSSGAIKVRIQHTSNGVSSHVLFVDQLVLSERRVYDRQTITGLVRINAGDTAWVMMKKDFANAQVMIQRYNVNLLRVGN